MPSQPLNSSLFPSTTLFRSPGGRRRAERVGSDWRVAAGCRRHQVDRLEGIARPRAAAQMVARAGRLENHAGHEEREEPRSEEHTSELQSLRHLVCRLLLEEK